MINRKIVSCLAVAVFAGLSTYTVSNATAGETKQEEMASLVLSWVDMEVRKSKNGYRRRVFRSPTTTLEELEMHITTLNPGIQNHELHKHANEEMFIIKEGIGEVLFEGGSVRVGPGSVYFQKSNELHAFRNVGDVPITYYVISYVSEKTLALKAQSEE